MSNNEALTYFSELSKRIQTPLETRNKAPDSSEIDVAFMQRFVGQGFSLLDLGSGTGLLLNEIKNGFSHITAVEKFESLSRFICEDSSIEIINEGILELKLNKEYDVISAFGIMNLFSSAEAEAVYLKCRDWCVEGGCIVIKHQMGIAETVLVKGHSAELGTDYFSEYRTVDNEISLLESAGFVVTGTYDYYPARFNRWPNTRFLAIIGQLPTKA